MTRYVTALDDYLHLIVRTRPWTKREDEALLADFGEWLEAQSVERLDAVTPELVHAYARDGGLIPAKEQAFYTAVRRLGMWAEWQGLVPAESLSRLAETDNV
jgi:hypothetical protein